MNTQNWLNFTVYRAADGDFTRNGLSSRVENLHVVGVQGIGERVARPIGPRRSIEADHDRAVVLRAQRGVFASSPASLHAVPATLGADGEWRAAAGTFQFGANFAAPVNSVNEEFWRDWRAQLNLDGVEAEKFVRIHDRLE